MSRAGRFARVYDVHGEKFRYLVVGLANTAVGYALFLVLLKLLGPPVRSLAGSGVGVFAVIGRGYYLAVQWFTWVLAVPLSTITMKHFVFGSPGDLWHEIRRAYCVYLPAQGISSLILWLTVAVAHLIPQVGQLAAIVVSTVFSYLGHKYFTFNSADRHPA